MVGEREMITHVEADDRAEFWGDRLFREMRSTREREDQRAAHIFRFVRSSHG